MFCLWLKSTDGGGRVKVSINSHGTALIRRFLLGSVVRLFLDELARMEKGRGRRNTSKAVVILFANPTFMST